MYYYEVLPADSRYHSGEPLTYASQSIIKPRSTVTVQLRNHIVTGFILNRVDKPNFEAKLIKNILSSTPLPKHCFDLAEWMSVYYGSSLGESLRQFAPSKPTIRKASADIPVQPEGRGSQLQLDSPLTAEQISAIKKINDSSTHTVLLHGDTGSGKTRVYMELAESVIKKGRSIIMLTPEIALTSQLSRAIRHKLHLEPFLIHSQLTIAERKKIWLKILESKEPVVIVGARSALFSPVANLGLIIIDEAHEPAYKQEQSPRYHTTRTASKLGTLTGSKVILGSATPSVTDYYLAKERGAIVEMTEQAITRKKSSFISETVDIKDRSNFSSSPYISETLIKAVRTALSEKKQALIYFNRRGTARLMMCSVCGWQLHCPNCDIPLTYHADTHSAQCHICGHKEPPPRFCPTCSNPDVIYKTIGTKALTEMVMKLFPGYNIARFDSDNKAGERIEELYPDIVSGKIDILVGTQLLAKGLDLPRLGVVGVISAETSLAIPDFSAEERTFQLLYQVIGRVGRGHGTGKVIVQSYDPKSTLLASALKRDYASFYNQILTERRMYKFPPSSYLAKVVCKRLTIKGAQSAALKLKKALQSENLPVEILGPAPSFYEKRGKYYFWHLVIKSKDRTNILKLAQKIPAGWTIDLDPIDLL